MDDLVLHLDANGTILDFRGRIENKLLLSGDVVGRVLYDLIPHDAAEKSRRSMEEAIKTGDLTTFEYPFPADSQDLYLAKCIANGGDKVLVLISNITDYRDALDKARYLAHHDTLTTLPNRVLFTDHLKRAVAHAARKNDQLAILFIDLDNFKQINDTLGHKAGDQLLKSVGDRLMKSVRSTDSIIRLSNDEPECVVARLGGDEFTILLTDISSIQDPARVSQRILNTLSESFTIGHHELFITASVGIAVYPFDGRDIDTLLTAADVAMYHAKDLGRNNYQYYSGSMNKFTLMRFTIENKLRKALDHNEFMLFYQPQFDLSTGRMIGVEALIRWLQPDLVLVKPGEFIPLAEETGLIIPIGEWVLRTACEQSRTWQKAGFTPVRMTVNVSSLQFRQVDFVDTLSQILTETGMDPQHLQLELTESAIMKDSEMTIRKLHALQSMGVQISIDDFGTGYSSLNYLKRFPLSTLKVDSSFIRDLMTSPVDRSIVTAIVSLAHNFNLKVIAEGVETRNQLSFLSECGCEGVQGFLICPPVNSTFLAQFIKKEQHLAILKSHGVKT